MKSNLLYDEVPYADIVRNWANRESWNRWFDCKYIAVNIPCSKLKTSIEAKIRRFTNNWLIESAVAKSMSLDFCDTTHDTFHTGYGKMNPDFISKDGITYELKTTKIYDYDDMHWWKADIHLYYDIKAQVLYEQIKDGSYIAIKEVFVYLLGE